MTATLEATVEQAERSTHILKRTVALVLRCGQLGNSRRVELTQFEVRKDGTELGEKQKAEVRASKPLFSNKTLRPAERKIIVVKDSLAALSVDGGTKLFGAGTYLLPLLAVKDALAIMKTGKADAAAEAEKLAAKLPELLEKRRAEVPDLFDLSQYPTADEIRAAYRVTWNFVSFQTPEQLEEVDVAAYEAARADQDARLAEAYDDVIIGLRTSAAVVMRELAAKLSGDADGKPKALRPQALDDLQSLLQRLPVLNSVGKDEKLADALARVGALAEGVDVETLRNAPAVRAMLLKAATAAAADLDDLVVSGRRAMALGGGPLAL